MSRLFPSTCKSSPLPEPPLTFHSLRLTPHTLSSSADDPISSHIVPDVATPTPSPSPSFSLSPTHNYPSPFGVISLGSTFSLHARLTNTRPDGGEVLGAKMMIEIQGPGGRYRLGEVIHGAETQKEKEKEKENDTAGKTQSTEVVKEDVELSALVKGDSVELDVESEMKEIDLHVLICSIAWETPEGRRTFQRFLKFNASIFTPPTPPC